jgi:hypothetical protein
MSNLLSGFIGALVGGLFSVVAAVMTIRHERAQVRKDASYAASGAITDNILIIGKAMYETQRAMDPARKAPGSEIYALREKVHSAAQSILYRYNVVIANKDLRSRIGSLVNMVNIWYENALNSSADVNQKRIDSINSYTRCVNDSIQAHLDGQSLPPDEPHPIS